MKHWRYVDPGPDMKPIEVIKSEDQIVAEYFSYWSDRMRRAGRAAHLITRANCIEDWIVVNWAEPYAIQRR